jgi:hypothetical protein
MGSRSRVISGALLAACALSMLAAAGAQAVMGEGPFYKVAKERLKSGESKEIQAKAGSTVFKFTVAEVGRKPVIQCTHQSYLTGSKINGSTGANSATGEVTMKFTGCLMENDGTPCAPRMQTFQTKPLKSQLVFLNKERTGSLGIVFSPVSGTTFAEIGLEGMGCQESNIKLAGSVAGYDESGNKIVTVGEEPAEATANEVNFPSTTIKIAYAEESGSLVELKPELEYFGVVKGSSMSGNSILELLSGSSWGVFSL